MSAMVTSRDRCSGEQMSVGGGQMFDIHDDVRTTNDCRPILSFVYNKSPPPTDLDYASATGLVTWASQSQGPRH